MFLQGGDGTQNRREKASVLEVGRCAWRALTPAMRTDTRVAAGGPGAWKVVSFSHDERDLQIQKELPMAGTIQADPQGLATGGWA